jgi:hypothetical protein
MSRAMLARKAEAAPAAPTLSATENPPNALRIGASGDAFEQEADRVADAVMASGDKSPPQWSLSRMSIDAPLQRQCACGGSASAGGECEECKEEKKTLQRKATGATQANQAPPIVHEVLGSPGRPLDRATRDFFEPRFGRDLGGVRFHSDDKASESAKAVRALAYTVGNHVVFQAGALEPQTREGSRLIAHELAHVVQQSGDTLRRAPDPQALKEFDERAEKIKKHPEFLKLHPARKQLVLEILAEARKRDDALDLMGKLETLFNTPLANPKDQSAATEATIEQAATQNTARLEEQKQQTGTTDEGREEAISQTHTFRTAKGRGATFQIDDRDVTNIAVKAKIHLETKSKSKGQQDAIKNIKSLEDAIEKRASTWGYNVDLEFVDHGGPDVFTISVDTGAWATAGNLAGNDPTLAHELHHLLGLEEDRYDYKNHATNPGMPISDRVYWFRQEFKKKITNDPDSIMAVNTKSPLDDDVCMVAGRRDPATIDACVQQRSDARGKIIGAALNQACTAAEKTRDIVTDDAKMTTGLDRAHIAEQLFDHHFPVDRARASTSAVATKLNYMGILNLLPGKHFMPVSSLADGCEQNAAIVPATDMPLQLCPQFFSINTSDQSKALLHEALHFVGVGDPSTDQPCGAQDCTTSCGGENSADTWVKFIECMAKT